MNGSSFSWLIIFPSRQQSYQHIVSLVFPSSIAECKVLISVNSDITDVRYVINYDFPQCCEDYVHRVGRTARGNDVGTSYTFMTNKDAKMVKNLIEILEESGQKVPDDLRALGHTGGKFGGRGGKSDQFNVFHK